MSTLSHCLYSNQHLESWTVRSVLPYLWGSLCEKVNDGLLYPLFCQISCCCGFNSSQTHTHTHNPHPQPIISNDLMVNLRKAPSLTNRLILAHPQSVHTGTHKTKMFTLHATAEVNTRNVGIHSHNRPKAQVSTFTILSLTLLWLMRGRATELAHCLWEKDKRPVESIETGAPVFITLVYRLNSHLPSHSAKCPLDLLFSCLHLKQFIKIEWEESKTLRAGRWARVVNRRRE